MKYTRFEELPVWRDATELARLVFEFTLREQFQRHPGLRNQLENSTLSISNNIAEGFERGSTNELLAFLYIARAARLTKPDPCCGLCMVGAYSRMPDLTLRT